MANNEVRIRNVDPAALAKIDSLANKKNMSRNSYLKAYIETLSILGELKELESRYASLVERMGDIVEHNTNEMIELRIIIERSVEVGK